MTMIYEIIGKLLAAACFALLAYLTPKAKKWLEARTGKDHYDQLMQLVQAFARASEQLYLPVRPFLRSVFCWGAVWSTGMIGGENEAWATLLSAYSYKKCG